ncbi:MAG: hypothetical protein LBP59_02360 [Planctomycetaceae bacterium]|nr:hypothetical protein [Planctomycetaceae bacterium]
MPECRRDARDPLVSPAFQNRRRSCLHAVTSQPLVKEVFKLFVLYFAFTIACLVFRRQALTLLNC